MYVLAQPLPNVIFSGHERRAATGSMTGPCTVFLNHAITTKAPQRKRHRGDSAVGFQAVAGSNQEGCRHEACPLLFSSNPRQARAPNTPSQTSSKKSAVTPCSLSTTWRSVQSSATQSHTCTGIVGLCLPYTNSNETHGAAGEPHRSVIAVPCIAGDRGEGQLLGGCFVLLLSVRLKL